MTRYASGKHALGISDRSGRAYKMRNMIMEWNGLLVGRDEFETKQPQLMPRHVVTQANHGRSTGDLVRFRSVSNFDGFTASAIEYSTGYSITKVNDNQFSFDVSDSGSSETASDGNTKGGGQFSSAGPVTVSP